MVSLDHGDSFFFEISINPFLHHRKRTFLNFFLYKTSIYAWRKPMGCIWGWLCWICLFYFLIRCSMYNGLDTFLLFVSIITRYQLNDRVLSVCLLCFLKMFPMTLQAMSWVWKIKNLVCSFPSFERTHIFIYWQFCWSDLCHLRALRRTLELLIPAELRLGGKFFSGDTQRA